MAYVTTGMEFGQALCEHFGLNAREVSSDIKLHTRPDEIFGVTLNIALTAADIESIGKIMAKPKISQTRIAGRHCGKLE